MSEEYLKRGVSPTKEDVHKAIAKQSKGLFPGAFCKVVAEPGGDADTATIMHADGAGTKSAIAYMVYAETGNADVFKGIAQDSLVMNLDDLICVGATSGFLVSNTIGRNAHRVRADAVKAIIEGYQEFVTKLAGYSIEIELAGGETADVGDLVRTVIVDSTVLCRLPRASVIDFSRVAAGDLIVGLSSYGRARYEDDENSGIGSNGFTLARHALLRREYAERFPETFSETIPADAVYGGKFSLADTVPGTGRPLSFALLSPTRTYVPIVRTLLASPVAGSVTGILHCSGGGQSKCLGFGKGLHYIKDQLLRVPPIFGCIAEQGVEPRQMFQVFNMGHRLEVYVRPQAAQAVIDCAGSFGVEAQVIGRVEAFSGAANKLTIATAGAELVYE